MVGNLKAVQMFVHEARQEAQMVHSLQKGKVARRIGFDFRGVVAEAAAAAVREVLSQSS